MFGRKNKIKEQIKEAFVQIEQHRGDFQTRMSSADERGKQMQEDISQVMENTASMTAYAMQNVEEESVLLHTMDKFNGDFHTAMEEYQQIAGMVKENYEAVTNLVEENKHYTTPSKYLTEIPGKLRKEYQAYERKTEELAESARQMSVQAINAAVEAGRMGESGKKFVAASEELRQMALDYEKSVLVMKEDLEASQERVQELEEYVLRLVALIKDGNVGTTRLMKKYMTLHKAVEACSMGNFSDEVALMRDKVVSIRNLDEEMVKSSERNKIQLTDIQEELKTQKQELRELDSDLSYLFDDVVEQIH